MRRTFYLTICVVVACCAWSSAAYAKAILLEGQYVEENPGVPLPFAPPDTTLCEVDVDDSTLRRCTFVGGTATLRGTWTGQNLTSGTFTYNVTTDEFSGRYKETFTGSSDGVGFGQVMSEGTFAATSEDFRADARIVSGTGDFVGSRGRITYIGDTPGNTSGHYSGKWILP